MAPAASKSFDTEKASLLDHLDDSNSDSDDAAFYAPEPRPSRFRNWLSVIMLATILVTLRIAPYHFSEWTESVQSNAKPSCPQLPPLVPATKIIETLEKMYATEIFQNRSAAWLSGAVQIPCVE